MARVCSVLHDNDAHATFAVPMTPNAPRPRKTRRSEFRSPPAVTMAMLPQWMQRTQTLMALKEQALTSQKMWAALRTALPSELVEAVRPGKWAEGTWHLTASSSAVAAKLKLYRPLLLRHLQQAQWPVQRIAVRVNEPASPQAPSRALDPTVTTSQAPAAVRARLRELRARHARDHED